MQTQAAKSRLQWRPAFREKATGKWARLSAVEPIRVAQFQTQKDVMSGKVKGNCFPPSLWYLFTDEDYFSGSGGGGGGFLFSVEWPLPDLPPRPLSARSWISHNQQGSVSRHTCRRFLLSECWAVDEEVKRQVEHEEHPYHSQAGQLQVEPRKHNKPGRSSEQKYRASSNWFVFSRI